jgi:hypothetical protein
MIELNRYVRVKPAGLSWAEVTREDGGGLNIHFKRFDVENGREIEPEKSFVAWKELEEKQAELEKQIVAIREFLALKPGP